MIVEKIDEIVEILNVSISYGIKNLGLLRFVWVNIHNSGKNDDSILSFRYSRSLIP